MNSKEFHGLAFLDRASGKWVAMCLEYNVVTHGQSEAHAFEMLKEAIELHLEDTPARDLELTHQPVDSPPVIRKITVDAPAPILS